MLALFITLLCLTYCKANEENVLQTEVFQITIDPGMFNWTFEGIKDQFLYEATLSDLPDIPSWLNFVYSDRHRSAFLYGVAPLSKTNSYNFDIFALNRKTFETKQEPLKINVAEKLNPATYEVHMKIDNINVVDMFDVDRMEALKDIFKKQLWKDSERDLYVTFLNSALDLGARKPPNPTEEEGIVIKLGSQEPFSSELLELQEEIKPLWKVPLCPRDFKRTSVERYFRTAGFALDWCMFRLIGDHNSSIGINEKLLYNEMSDDDLQSVSRNEIPAREYVHELVYSCIVPMCTVMILTLILTFIICFNHAILVDEASEDFFNNLFHICTDIRDDCTKRDNEETTEYSEDGEEYNSAANETLYAINNDLAISPEPILFSLTSSPTSTLNHGVHCRPSPPPYVRPKFKPEI